MRTQVTTEKLPVLGIKKLHSEAEKEFEINSLEWLHHHHKTNQSKVAERLKMFEFVFVKKGTGSISIDLKQYSITENTVYCLVPGQYKLLLLNPDIQGYHITLSSEFLYLAENHADFNFFAAQCKADRDIPILKAHAEIEEIIIRMQTEFANCLNFRTEILKGFLKIFIIYLNRQIDQNSVKIKPDKDKDLVKKFMLLVKTHFAQKKLVSEYADELCVTPNYLNSIIKRMTGSPASHHIQQYIILEAKRQAHYSDLRMKEVALNLGFEDYAHFSKFFKNYSGINYTNYRKNIA